MSFRFYIGLPDYAIFKIVYDSNINIETLASDQVKRGPKRTFRAEQESFLVLVSEWIGLLQEDISM